MQGRIKDPGRLPETIGLPIESDDMLTSDDLDQLGAVSPALRALVEVDSRDHVSFRELLLDALNEQGTRLPQPREAVIFLSTQVAQAILEGRISPIDGAEAIWRLSIQFDDDYPELSTFKFAALEHELARKNSSDVVTYYLADHLGSIVQETSASGAVILER